MRDPLNKAILDIKPSGIRKFFDIRTRKKQQKDHKIDQSHNGVKGCKKQARDRTDKGDHDT